LVHDFGGANERAESRFVSAIFPESTVNTFEIGTSSFGLFGSRTSSLLAVHIEPTWR